MSSDVTHNVSNASLSHVSHVTRRLTSSEKYLSNSYKRFTSLDQLLIDAYEFIHSIFVRERFRDNNAIHRRLIDTYAASLIHVNRIYNKRFGYESRKVPAHMPHMINKEIVSEMQDMFPSEWNDTTSHRFRSIKDMQYSFSYYYYLIHTHKHKIPNFTEYTV